MAIYRDKKRGTYYFSVYVDVNGESKRFVRRGFANKNEAKKAEIDFLYNFDAEGEENISFSKLAHMYLRWYEKRRKNSSYTKIESVTRVHILPEFGNKLAKDVTKRNVIMFHDELLSKLKPVSAKKVHTVLSAILNHGISLEYLKINVAREVGNVDVLEDKRINFWTVDEFKQFISVVDDNFYKSFFMMLFYGGFRKGELLALTWKDIDFESNTIDINKTVYQRNVTSPKNRSSVRIVKLPEHTMKLLKEKKLQSKNKLTYVVFGNFFDHKPETTIDRDYNIYVKTSKLKRIRLHDFRHSHASYLIHLGIDISVISKRLGHANTSTTYDVYGHLYPNAEDTAISIMEDDFKPAEVIEISDYQ